MNSQPDTKNVLETRSLDASELDDLWAKLSAVPEAEQCGWLKDQYGVSWQIVPTIAIEMLSDPGTPRYDARYRSAS